MVGPNNFPSFFTPFFLILLLTCEVGIIPVFKQESNAKKEGAFYFISKIGVEEFPGKRRFEARDLPGTVSSL